MGGSMVRWRSVEIIRGWGEITGSLADFWLGSTCAQREEVKIYRVADVLAEAGLGAPRRSADDNTRSFWEELKSRYRRELRVIGMLGLEEDVEEAVADR